MDTKQEWYKEWFNEDYRRLYTHRSDQEAEEQIAFVLDKTPQSQVSTAVDLGCGEGRHCLALGKRGVATLGLDLSPTLLQHAEENCKGLPVKFLQANLLDDHRDLGPFDLAISMFTSFGYFSEEQNQILAHNISQMLKVKGCFFLDYLDPKEVKGKLVEKEEKTVNGEKVKINRQIIGNQVIKTILFPNKQYCEKVYLFKREEIEKIFEAHGFELVNFWNSYALQKENRQLFMFQRVV